MAAHPDDDTIAETVDVLAHLRHISERMARFEDIPQAELDAFDARKRALCDRIEPGFYDGLGEADVLGDLLAAGKLDGIPYGDESED